MARVSKQQMEHNREAIIQVSSTLFREHGLNGVSLNDLMAAAGLTHGGFYGHFASKDELAAIAGRKAIETSNARWQHLSQETGLQGLEGLVAFYLSTTHRDNAGEGCLVTALASDVARAGVSSLLSHVYLDGVNGLLAQLESLSDIEDTAQRRAHALAQLSMLCGALTLARATAGDAISEEILDAARHALLADKQ